MKKLFVFADVHGFYNELKNALDKAGFDIQNPDHIIISLGDACDRGPDATKVLNFINNIPKDRKICIIGNHELLMESMIARGDSSIYDITNGTINTAEQLTCITGHPSAAIYDMKSNSQWNTYKKFWQWYFEVGNYIFVHGWIPCATYSKWGTLLGLEYNADWRNASSKKWEDATWVNGMDCWAKGIREPNKTIFCGHWHTSYGHANLHHYGVEFLNKIETYHFDEELQREVPFADYGPFIDEGIVALDACTVVSHFVNVYTIEIEDNIWEEVTM